MISAARTSICFVAPDAYPVLAGGAGDLHFGGAAIQQVLIARELCRRGLRVNFVTWDYGQPDGVQHDGIAVWKMCPREAGLVGLRFLHPRWTSLCAALQRADADLYYQRGAGSETGQVAIWCRMFRRGFVFAAASDTNCQPNFPDLPTRRERVLYRLGLRLAARVVAQSERQVHAFREMLGREPLLVRSCGQDGFTPRAFRESGTPARLLWVGRLAPKKRFELLLDLAEVSPDWLFDVVGDSIADGAYASALIARARQLPNVTLHGRLPHHSLDRIYDRADLLLCTSPVEGFPNTFLEAWARGIPTVSTVDPDGMIAARGLGAVATHVSQLREAIRQLLESRRYWTACSEAAFRYFGEHHSVRAAGQAYERLVEQVLETVPPAAGKVVA